MASRRAELEATLENLAADWVQDHREEIASGQRNPWSIAEGFSWPIAAMADAALGQALTEAGLR